MILASRSHSGVPKKSAVVATQALTLTLSRRERGPSGRKPYFADLSADGLGSNFSEAELMQ